VGELIVQNLIAACYLLLDLICGSSNGAAAERKGPGYSQRHENRARLKTRMLRELWGKAWLTKPIRMVAALEDIMASSSGNIVIIGHAGGIRLLLCHMLGMPITNLQNQSGLRVFECDSVWQYGVSGQTDERKRSQQSSLKILPVT
jgi:hypothetical protein